MPMSESRYKALAQLVARLRPIRTMPVSSRYFLTTMIVLFFFAIRWLLRDIYPYPYLVFLPAIVLASVVFDRGTGFYGTLLSAGLAIYFFIEPRTTFVLADVGAVLSVLLFTAVGLLLAGLIELLRNSVEAIAEAYERIAARESELRQSANLMEAIIEGVPDPISVKDADGRYIRVNTALATTIGAPKAAILGNRDRDLLPSDMADAAERVDADVLARRTAMMLEEQIAVGPTGARRWFLSTKAPLYDPGSAKPSGIIAVSQDIDQRKRAEDDLKAVSAQREILLHDINHRVKNHLQSVVATLNLSGRSIQDPAAKVVLSEASNRLTVLARVYDRLQLTGPGTTVEIGEFIESICEDISPTIIGERPIALRVTTARAQLDSSRAVSIGLLLNEALTNELKHAFPMRGQASSWSAFNRKQTPMFSRSATMALADPTSRAAAGSART